MSTCVTIWCDRPAVVRGLCRSCYDRLWKGISTSAPARGYAVAEDKERLRSEITARREAGQSIADIAAAVDVSTSTASKWLREWGVGTGRQVNARPAKLWQPWKPEDIKIAVGRTDLSLSDRASKLDRSVSSVIECIRKHGHRGTQAPDL